MAKLTFYNMDSGFFNIKYISPICFVEVLFYFFFF